MSVLNRLFARALTLDIDGQPITFHGQAEFEFTLSGRTDLPARKLADLMTLTLVELKQEARAIKAVEQRFVKVMANTLDAPHAIAEYLREVDPLVFSQDHDWRSIIRALNDKDHEYDDLRRIALAKYMQYLRSRQDVIKHLYKAKKTAEGGLDEKLNETQNLAAQDLDIPPFLRETLLFDSLPNDTSLYQEPPFTRLLKGEATTVALYPHKPLALRFSKHQFWLVSAGELRITGAHDWSAILATGRNLIGRDGVCNAVIDNTYRDISRIHCLIDFADSPEIRLTDLSAHGTYIPTAALGPT